MGDQPSTSQAIPNSREGYENDSVIPAAIQYDNEFVEQSAEPTYAELSPLPSSTNNYETYDSNTADTDQTNIPSLFGEVSQIPPGCELCENMRASCRRIMDSFYLMAKRSANYEEIKEENAHIKRQLGDTNKFVEDRLKDVFALQTELSTLKVDAGQAKQREQDLLKQISILEAKAKESREHANAANTWREKYSHSVEVAKTLQQRRIDLEKKFKDVIDIAAGNKRKKEFCEKQSEALRKEKKELMSWNILSKKYVPRFFHILDEIASQGTNLPVSLFKKVDKLRNVPQRGTLLGLEKISDNSDEEALELESILNQTLPEYSCSDNINLTISPTVPKDFIEEDSTSVSPVSNPEFNYSAKQMKVTNTRIQRNKSNTNIVKQDAVESDKRIMQQVHCKLVSNSPLNDELAKQGPSTPMNTIHGKKGKTIREIQEEQKGKGTVKERVAEMKRLRELQNSKSVPFSSPVSIVSSSIKLSSSSEDVCKSFQSTPSTSHSVEPFPTGENRKNFTVRNSAQATKTNSESASTSTTNNPPEEMNASADEKKFFIKFPEPISIPTPIPPNNDLRKITNLKSELMVSSIPSTSTCNVDALTRVLEKALIEKETKLNTLADDLNMSISDADSVLGDDVLENSNVLIEETTADSVIPSTNLEAQVVSSSIAVSKTNPTNNSDSPENKDSTNPVIVRKSSVEQVEASPDIKSVRKLEIMDKPPSAVPRKEKVEIIKKPLPPVTTSKWAEGAKRALEIMCKFGRELQPPIEPIISSSKFKSSDFVDDPETATDIEMSLKPIDISKKSELQDENLVRLENPSFEREPPKQRDAVSSETLDLNSKAGRNLDDNFAESSTSTVPLAAIEVMPQPVVDKSIVRTKKSFKKVDDKKQSKNQIERVHSTLKLGNVGEKSTVEVISKAHPIVLLTPTELMEINKAAKTSMPKSHFGKSSGTIDSDKMPPPSVPKKKPEPSNAIVLPVEGDEFSGLRKNTRTRVTASKKSSSDVSSVVPEKSVSEVTGLPTVDSCVKEASAAEMTDSDNDSQSLQIEAPISPSVPKKNPEPSNAIVLPVEGDEFSGLRKNTRTRVTASKKSNSDDSSVVPEKSISDATCVQEPSAVEMTDSDNDSQLLQIEAPISPSVPKKNPEPSNAIVLPVEGDEFSGLRKNTRTRVTASKNSNSDVSSVVPEKSVSEVTGLPTVDSCVKESSAAEMTDSDNDSQSLQIEAPISPSVPKKNPEPSNAIVLPVEGDQFSGLRKNTRTRVTASKKSSSDVSSVVPEKSVSEVTCVQEPSAAEMTDSDNDSQSLQIEAPIPDSDTTNESSSKPTEENLPLPSEISSECTTKEVENSKASQPIVSVQTNAVNLLVSESEGEDNLILDIKDEIASPTKILTADPSTTKKVDNHKISRADTICKTHTAATARTNTVKPASTLAANTKTDPTASKTTDKGLHTPVVERRKFPQRVKPKTSETGTVITVPIAKTESAPVKPAPKTKDNAHEHVSEEGPSDHKNIDCAKTEDDDDDLRKDTDYKKQSRKPTARPSKFCDISMLNKFTQSLGRGGRLMRSSRTKPVIPNVAKVKPSTKDESTSGIRSVTTRSNVLFKSDAGSSDLSRRGRKRAVITSAPVALPIKRGRKSKSEHEPSNILDEREIGKSAFLNAGLHLINMKTTKDNAVNSVVETFLSEEQLESIRKLSVDDLGDVLVEVVYNMKNVDLFHQVKLSFQEQLIKDIRNKEEEHVLELAYVLANGNIFLSFIKSLIRKVCMQETIHPNQCAAYTRLLSHALVFECTYVDEDLRASEEERSVLVKAFLNTIFWNHKACIPQALIFWLLGNSWRLLEFLKEDRLVQKLVACLVEKYERDIITWAWNSRFQEEEEVPFIPTEVSSFIMETVEDEKMNIEKCLSTETSFMMDNNGQIIISPELLESYKILAISCTSSNLPKEAAERYRSEFCFYFESVINDLSEAFSVPDTNVLFAETTTSKGRNLSTFKIHEICSKMMFFQCIVGYSLLERDSLFYRRSLDIVSRTLEDIRSIRNALKEESDINHLNVLAPVIDMYIEFAQTFTCHII